MIEEKAVDILNQLEALAKQYTPDVIDAAVDVTRLNGASEILSGVLLLISAALVAKLSNMAFKFCRKKEEKDRYSSWEIGVAGSITLGTCLVIFSVLIGASEILDVWNWVAIFNPKLALAKQIMGM